MAKKKARIPHYNHADGPRYAKAGGSGSAGPDRDRKPKKMNAFSRVSVSGQAKGAGPGSNPQHQDQRPPLPKQRTQRPVVPFNRRDRILLVGEGDFSFSRSLVTQHKCKNVLATCYDSQAALEEKYAPGRENIAAVLRKGKRKRGAEGGDDGAEQTAEEEQGRTTSTLGPLTAGSPRILFSIDARKLGAGVVGGGKDVRHGFPRPPRNPWAHGHRPRPPAEAERASGPWDLICFNFPHVGGLSTDVNRQVRANQELLVAFFKACVPLLSLPEADEFDSDEDEEEEAYERFYNSESESEGDGNGDGDGGDEGQGAGAPENTPRKGPRKDPGQVLVTLFEGEPYTLWNIRDLARHAGLRVVTSFRFPWASYPGYEHARTIGEIEGRHGGRGGWRGEDREARTYVFELQVDDRSKQRPQQQKPKQKANAGSKAKLKDQGKRKREESSDEEGG